MSYLIHHGIRGQKWGKRNGPPYPLSPGDHSKSEKDAGWRKSLNNAKDQSGCIVTNPDGSKTIKKGFKLNRVGKDHLDVNQSGGLYVSYGENDLNRYVKSLGPSLVGRMLGTSATTIQHISVEQDLRMPSNEQFAKECANIFLKNNDLFDSYSNGLYSMLFTGDFYENFSRKSLEYIFANPGSKEAKKFAHSVNSYFGDPNYADDTKQIYSEFRKKSFDAIPDLHDTMTATSETAFIVINPSKVRITSTTSITKERYKEAKKFVKSLEELKMDDIFE